MTGDDKASFGAQPLVVKVLIVITCVAAVVLGLVLLALMVAFGWRLVAWAFGGL